MLMIVYVNTVQSVFEITFLFEKLESTYRMQGSTSYKQRIEQVHTGGCSVSFGWVVILPCVHTEAHTQMV